MRALTQRREERRMAVEPPYTTRHDTAQYTTMNCVGGFIETALPETPGIGIQDQSIHADRWGQRALPLGCGGRRGAPTLPATREDLQLRQAIEDRAAFFQSPLLSFTSFRSFRSLHNRNSLRVVRLRRT